LETDLDKFSTENKRMAVDCIFCKIIAKQIPAEIIYENENAIAILDLNPIHYGHTLIIPKIHCKEFTELPESCYDSVFDAAKVVAKALVQAFNLEGYNLFSNNGTIAGQSVFHFHMHVTPRYRHDNIQFILKLKKYSSSEMTEYGNKIRKFILNK
jgi:histidine triad (HIT) family protein